MNKKLIKILTTCLSCTAVVGVGVSGVCYSVSHISSLVIDHKAEDIDNEVIGTPITSTTDISQDVYKDSTSGKKVVGDLTFTTEPALPDGLSIDEHTGVISGTPTVACNNTYKIKVSRILDGYYLEGASNNFIINILDPQTYYEYIDQRTISIAACADIPSYGAVFSKGTAWFYKRLGDYTYEFITTYSTYYEIANTISLASAGIGATCLLAVLGNDSSNVSQSEYKHYIQDTIAIGGVSDLNDLIIPICKSITGPGIPSSTYMDMCAFTLDLENAYGLDKTLDGRSTKGIDTFKAKIDYINGKYKVGDKIVDLAPATPEVGDRLFTAGYPWATSHTPTDADRGYTEFTGVNKKVSEVRDDMIYQPSSYYSTYQKINILEKDNQFDLGSGAAGSMVINSDYKVVGIYWGGLWKPSEDPGYFYPSLALFDINDPSTGQNFNFFKDLVDPILPPNQSF